MAVEDLADEVVHLRVAARAGLAAPWSWRKRVVAFVIDMRVVADLEDRDPAHADRDLLRVDSLDVEDRLVRLQRQVLRLLQDGITSAPPPVTILNVLPARRPAPPLAPRPVMISAWSAAGTFQSTLKATTTNRTTSTTPAMMTISAVLIPCSSPRSGTRVTMTFRGGS